MSTQRLFIALTPPEAVRNVVAGLATRLKGVRWTPVEQLHVTLRFLGDLPIENRDALIERLAGVRVQPFVLPIEGVGAFPSQRAPRVLWVGVGKGHPVLHQLRQQIDDALLALQWDVDLRTFHPHLTVARCDESSAGGTTQWVRSHQSFAGPPFSVEGFELYSSHLNPSGAIHTVVARFPFAK